MKVALKTCAASASLLAAAFASAPASADDSGVTRLTAAPTVANACAVEDRAAASAPSVETKSALASCFTRVGRVASAYQAWDDAASIAKKVGDKRGRVMAEQRDALEAHLSKLIIVLDAPAHVPGLTVTRDGAPIDPIELGRWLPVDPGLHTINVTAPARRAWEVTVRVAPEGGMETVTIPVLEGENVAPLPVDPTAREGRGQRTVALAIGGAGLAMIGVGAIFGIASQSKATESAKYCNPAPDSRCTDEGLALRSDQRIDATTATAAFIAGAVFIGTGVALYLTAPRGGAPRVGVAPAVGPQARGLLVTGSF
jgi:hypothetical protein